MSQNTNNLLGAIFGFGNMGQRHYDSFRKCGVEDFVLSSSTAKVKNHKNINAVYDSPKQLLDHECPDFAVISTPTSAHFEDLKLCIDRKIPVLVEKPVVASANEASQLRAYIKSINELSPIVIGYDLRFSNLFIKFSELTKDASLGKHAYTDWQAGGFMPAWRSSKLSNQIYSSNRALGGGVLLDLSHEIDAMNWFYGEPERVISRIRSQNNLGWDVEDACFISFEYPGNAFFVNITMDYLRSPFNRRILHIAENGTLELDESKGSIMWHDIKQESHELFSEDSSSGGETSFNREAKYLLSQMGFYEPMAEFLPSPLEESLRVVEMIDVAREASDKKCEQYISNPTQ